MRADLPRGVQAASLVHAAGESSPGGLPEGTNAVVLTVPTEEDLWRLSRALEDAGIGHKRIVEPDVPWSGALMAIGLLPVTDRKGVRRLTSSLPLLR